MFPEFMNQRAVPAMDVPAPLGPGMFDGLSQKAGPSAEEMEAERQRVLAHKHVEVTDHCVRVFDMHDKKDVEDYTKLMKELVTGTQALTHKVWVNDRQLVNRDGGQKWMCYMEWSVFALRTKHTQPLGTPKQKRAKT